MQHQSDLIRLQLLQKYGGLWVDATTYCIQPLDDWLPEKVTSGFFTFTKPRAGVPISNWFIYAETDNLILRTWLNMCVKFWETNVKPPSSFRRHTLDSYFIHHGLFKQMLKLPVIKVRYQEVVKSSCAFPGLNPHLIQNYTAPVSTRIQQCITTKQSPFFKLAWRKAQTLDLDTLPPLSTLGYLLQN